MPLISAAKERVRRVSTRWLSKETVSQKRIALLTDQTTSIRTERDRSSVLRSIRSDPSTDWTSPPVPSDEPIEESCGLLRTSRAWLIIFEEDTGFFA